MFFSGNDKTDRPAWLRHLGFMKCLVAMLAFSCSMGDDVDVAEERVGVGDRVPAFTVSVVENGNRTEFSTGDISGETVIVFFNTGCEDCRRELPRLNGYYLSHREEKGFRMVAISREEGEESVAEYWAANGLAIPYSAQTDRRIYSLFASSIIPRVYFCSAEGVITAIEF